MSDFNDWEQKEHAEDWLLFADDIGEKLSIDETSMTNGELFTILTNKSAKGKQGSIIDMVKGTNSETVINIIKKI